MSGNASVENIGNTAWKGIGYLALGAGLGVTSYLSGFNGASVAVATLGLAAEGAGLYTLGAKVLYPGYEKAKNYANGWIEWGKNFKDFRFGPADMASASTMSAGVTAIVLSNSWTATIGGAILTAGGAYVGYNYGETARIGTLVAAPDGAGASVLPFRGPEILRPDNLLHLSNTRYPITAPSDPNLKFTSLTAGFIGSMFDYDYVNANGHLFANKSGEQLIELFNTTDPENLLQEFGSNDPAPIGREKRRLMRDCLNTKFGIGISENQRKENQMLAREALVGTKAKPKEFNIEHPDIPGLGISGAEITGMLKDCYNVIKAENAPKPNNARPKPTLAGTDAPTTTAPTTLRYPQTGAYYPTNFG